MNSGGSPVTNIRCDRRTNTRVVLIGRRIRLKRPLTDRRGFCHVAANTNTRTEKKTNRHRHASRGKETFHSEPQYRNAENLKS
jgi:hypothetical protein